MALRSVYRRKIKRPASPVPVAQGAKYLGMWLSRERIPGCVTRDRSWCYRDAPIGITTTTQGRFRSLSGNAIESSSVRKSFAS